MYKNRQGKKKPYPRRDDVGRALQRYGTLWSPLVDQAYFYVGEGPLSEGWAKYFSPTRTFTHVPYYE